MIKDFLKNICLITFALIGPITLPAGGIQRNLNNYKSLDKSKEIILSSNCPIYSYPQAIAKKLIVFESGSSLSILRTWKVNERNVWVRVELMNNKLADNPNRITRGWMKL
tara:strand:+ start:41 stop:370 length:330 start_codon:yes stop_codon:yes gene_type:complete